MKGICAMKINAFACLFGAMLLLYFLGIAVVFCFYPIATAVTFGVLFMLNCFLAGWEIRKEDKNSSDCL